jgi:hypothetical protein
MWNELVAHGAESFILPSRERGHFRAYQRQLWYMRLSGFGDLVQDQVGLRTDSQLQFALLIQQFALLREQSHQLANRWQALYNSKKEIFVVHFRLSTDTLTVRDA